MRIIKTVDQLREYLDSLEGSLGFVPTMGALHNGHLSLVKESASKCTLTIVSIFINPTQFNDPNDLKNYPRDIEKDKDLLGRVLKEDDILFLPSYHDLYSREEEYTIDLEGLDRVMEGEHRPGHFEGVVRVVKLLFEAVKPHKAFFGQKDFQQLSIIRKMVEKLQLDIEIIACPILREENGLAMSSRNERLAPSTRKNAGIIFSSLSKYSNLKPQDDIPGIKKLIRAEIESYDEFRVEYLEVVDNLSLKPVNKLSDIKPGIKYFACIAVFAGEVRLIDNIEFSFQFVKG